jgi:hypothetical protein
MSGLGYRGDPEMLADLLNSVIRPHAHLATRLLRLVRRWSTATSSHEYGIAALIIFLAGVDKVLSLTLELLYLAGHVEWEWMRRRRRADVEPGEVFCDPGFMAKLAKLKELGCDVTEIDWLAELRNSYIHGCKIYGGYSVAADFDRQRVTVKPTGPTVNSGLTFLSPVRADDIDPMTTRLVERLDRFLGERRCEEALRRISERLTALPVDPQPWTGRLNASEMDPDTIIAQIRELNAEMVGEGLSKIIDSLS